MRTTDNSTIKAAPHEGTPPRLAGTPGTHPSLSGRDPPWVPHPDQEGSFRPTPPLGAGVPRVALECVLPLLFPAGFYDCTPGSYPVRVAGFGVPTPHGSGGVPPAPPLPKRQGPPFGGGSCKGRDSPEGVSCCTGNLGVVGCFVLGAARFF